MSPLAWLVDLDGTLYHLQPVQLIMQLELLCTGPTHVRAIAAFRRAHERERRSDPNGARGDPFARLLESTAARLRMSRADLEALVRHYMIERARRWIRMFRRRALLGEIERFRRDGGRCALVSDYPARSKLAALGAEQLFDAVIAAGEANGPTRLKPDPEGYLRAASALGVDPASCLVLGDREDADGAAARAAGMSFRRI